MHNIVNVAKKKRLLSTKTESDLNCMHLSPDVSAKNEY